MHLKRFFVKRNYFICNPYFVYILIIKIIEIKIFIKIIHFIIQSISFVNFYDLENHGHEHE